MYHARVEEIVRIDFIDRWQSHVSAVVSIEHGDGERGSEHAVVHVNSGPASRFVERLEVLRVVEQLEKHFHLVLLLRVERREDGTLVKEHPLLPPPEELLHDILKQMVETNIICSLYMFQGLHLFDLTDVGAFSLISPWQFHQVKILTRLD